MKKCIACGLPMHRPEDYAENDTGKDYCIHCARPDGSMQSFEERKDALTKFIITSQGFDETAAANLAENTMRLLPAWSGYFEHKKGDDQDV